METENPPFFIYWQGSDELNSIIDAHIHIDHYHENEIEDVITGDPTLAALIGVSFDFASCQRNLDLSNKYPKLQPAFGWHPEQDLINDNDFGDLLKWMSNHESKMIAVGEVGLPYYLRKEHTDSFLPIEGYIEILESFILFAKKIGKPIVLHAVYDDAPMVCDILEKHSLLNVHFHWFKGDSNTITRMIQNGYYVSITPDVLYEKEIRDLVRIFPIERIMVETDGPWPFIGPFEGKLTHPSMLHQSIHEVSLIKGLPINYVYHQLFQNTKNFYQLEHKEI